ncbi:MAG TPA: hypothetical protein VKO16_03230 [Polyangia bacterium]|nr:hypothetical protein [Polyangia bacterium]
MRWLARLTPISRRSWLPGGFGRIWIAAVVLGMAVGCHGAPRAVFARLAEARLLAADLRIQFSREVDASNRAVMADTDAVSIAFAHEAAQATESVEGDAGRLSEQLRGLGFPNETQMFDEFAGHWLEYRKLDRTILDLAVENTNLKAQSLSFGPASEAAGGFRDLLATVARATPAKDRCRVDALIGEALLDVREIQVLHAPHIAEPDDAAMARMEKQMADLEAGARAALHGLSKLVAPGARAQLASAIASLDRFVDVSKKIVALSRRNTNVRSLALSLTGRPPLTAACDGSLRALQEALAKEESTATR